MNSTRKFAGKILAYALLSLLAVICILPFYIMIINATWSNAEISKGINLLPGSYFLENYQSMSVSINVLNSLKNSLFIALSATCLTGYFGTLAAYGFAKFRFRGSKILFSVVLSTLMIPFQLSLLGIYQISSNLHVLNTYWPIILPSIANATTVFFMKAHVESVIDASFIEAARIDGYHELGIFHQVVFPLSKVGLMTISIMNFVFAWNDYMSPVMLLSDMKKFPIPVSIAVLKSAEQLDQGAVYCGVALSVVPIITMYLIFNSQITAGITAGGVKG